MHKITKLFIVLLPVFSLLFFDISYGEPGPWKKLLPAYKNFFKKSAASQRAKVLQPKQIEKILNKRVWRANKKIYHKGGLIEIGGLLFVNEYPLVFFKEWQPELGQALFQDQPWLLAAGPRAQQNYVISLHNRLAATLLKERAQLRKDLQKNSARLQSEILPLTQEPFALQAAKRIPPNTQQILIGEGHGVEKISQEILSFIQAVQARNPGRQIVYLTEFIPQNVDLDYLLSIMRLLPKDAHYYHIFDWLKRCDIPIIGLEPSWVWMFQPPQVSLGNLFQLKPYEVSLWESLGGVYLRNQSWLRVIASARKSYPHALFIIHAGYGHTDYNAPFNISKMFAPQETFVLRVLKNEGSIFHAFSGGKYSYPLLGWKDKQLAYLAGCDAQIKVD